MSRLPHIHRYHRVLLSRRHIHQYYECRCGARKVKRSYRGFQPLAVGWLNGGTYPECDRIVPMPKPTPPKGAKP